MCAQHGAAGREGARTSFHDAHSSSVQSSSRPHDASHSVHSAAVQLDLARPSACHCAHSPSLHVVSTGSASGLGDAFSRGEAHSVSHSISTAIRATDGFVTDGAFDELIGWAGTFDTEP